MAPRTLLLVLFMPIMMISCSSAPPAGQLIDGRLRPCPNRPNCITSETGSGQKIKPISFKTSPEKAWEQLRIILDEMGGEIVREEPTYLWAVFRSKILRLNDDVELRLAQEENHIHLRSGSRVGYSDLGVNRRRIEKIRKHFSTQANQATNPKSM